MPALSYTYAGREPIDDPTEKTGRIDDVNIRKIRINEIERRRNNHLTLIHQSKDL